METFEESFAACVEDTPGALVRFAETLDPQWVEAALQATGTASVRRRKLPAEHVVWLVLGMCLMMDRSILDVCDQLSLTMPNVKSLAPSAVANARYRLGPAPLAWLFQRLAREYAHRGVGETVDGLKLYAVDGTHLRVPDSDANFDAFGKPSSRNGTGDAGYPQVRLVALLNVESRMVAGAAFGPYNTGEQPLARELWEHIPNNSLTIFDRGFIDFTSFADIVGNGVERHLLVRMPKNMRFIETSALEDGSSLGFLESQSRVRKARPELPHRLDVRVVHYEHEGGAPSRVFTTVLEPERISALELVRLYHERWEIEIAFDELKTHLSGRREALRSLKPDGVKQEIWGLLLLYNLVRMEMALVAEQHGVPPRRVSFTTSLHLIRLFWLSAAQTRSPGNLPKRLIEHRATLGTMLLPERRSHRRYPRHVKIKMSNYKRNRSRRSARAIGEPPKSP